MVDIVNCHRLKKENFLEAGSSFVFSWNKEWRIFSDGSVRRGNLSCWIKTGWLWWSSDNLSCPLSSLSLDVTAM
jgi:hypothetical protein